MQNSFDNTKASTDGKKSFKYNGLMSYKKSKLLMSPGLDISQMEITQRDMLPSRSHMHSRHNLSIESSQSPDRNKTSEKNAS